ncbi:MAG: hypothetical protein ACP5GU_01325 [Thermoprotei archaeon]
MPERLIQSYMDIIAWISLSTILILINTISINSLYMTIAKTEAVAIYSQVNDAGYLAETLNASIKISIKSFTNNILIYLEDNSIIININSMSFTFKSDVKFKKIILETNKHYTFSYIDNYIVVSEG